MKVVMNNMQDTNDSDSYHVIVHKNNVGKLVAIIQDIVQEIYEDLLNELLYKTY